MKEDNKPSLKLISGGMGNTDKEEKSEKLTGKQEAFAQGLSEGLTNTEAYKRAYGAENMKASTIHVEACKLAQHPKITRRLDAILSEKRGKNSMSTLKASDRVWRNVWRLAEGENVPPSVQQAALALAAKMAGMLTDKVEIDQKITDSKSIEAEILERLQRLSA